MARKVYKGTSLSVEFEYPSGYDNTYSYMVSAASVAATLSGLVVTPGESTFEVSALATATAGWKPAKYRLQVRAEKEETVEIINCGYLEVLPSVFSDGAKAVDPDSTAQPPRTWRENVLVAAKAALLNFSGSGVISVNYDGGGQSFQTREELMSFIRILEREVHSRRKGRRFRVYQV